MKILITGKMGTGKSIFAKYLKSNHSDFTIVDFDDFGGDRNAFESKILNTKNCIVVIQHQKFISVSMSFDKIYECSRVSKNSFQVTDGFLVQGFIFKELSKFFDPRLEGCF